ncbi:MAG: phosphatase domain-containing protein [Pseudomonadota bacterium]
MAKSFLRGLARIVTKPARMVVSRRGIIIQPYRGYGTSKEVFMIGRVMRQPSQLGAQDKESLVGQLLEIGRWAARRGISKVPLNVRFQGVQQSLRTDRDGYFRVRLTPDSAPPPDRSWHDIDIELQKPEVLSASGEIFIPNTPADFVVISDIDDTIMHTGVANKIKMVWRLIGKGAESRVAIPGMPSLLRALYQGPKGQNAIPMLYVSRAPWAIYEVLDEFFSLNEFPPGPLLFLREWGLTLQSPLPRRSKNHKAELIKNMLALYHDLPFVLLGDSGQADPEIYHKVVHDNPGRVRAIYIRDLGDRDTRSQAIQTLAEEVRAHGATMLLTANVGEMARHARDHGLITSAAARAVEIEIDGAPAPTPDLVA